MYRPFLIRQVTYWIALVCLSLTLFLPIEAAKANDDAGSSSIWIPFVESGKVDDGNHGGGDHGGGDNGGGGNGGGDHGGGDNPPPPPPGLEAWAIFADTEWKTSNASAVTDADGGMHLGYLYYEAVDQGENAPTYGVYLYCASDCEDGANWNGVGFGNHVTEIQVALTPNGEPRVLYRQVAGERNGNDFFYGECNQVCTDPAQWLVTQVATNSGMSIEELNDDGLPQRYFALDPEGRPRFVYGDRDTWREPDHLGTFYAFCDSDCTNASNWFETQINKDNGGQGPYRAEKFHYPSLTFTATGQPRVVADGISMQDEFFLYYLSCNGDCGDPFNWISTPLFARGSGVNVSYDVAVDAQGRPRIAFYEGAQLEGKGDVLWYGWCDEACADGANWQRYELGLGWGEGQTPDLELDASGKPRIAYVLRSQGGLGYGRCDDDCETMGAQWQHQVVETNNDLVALWPMAHPQHCDGGIWEGATPSLSLDQSGNALIGYDAIYNARCWYDVIDRQWEPFPQFHVVWRVARAHFLPKP